MQVSLMPRMTSRLSPSKIVRLGTLQTLVFVVCEVMIVDFKQCTFRPVFDRRKLANIAWSCSPVDGEGLYVVEIALCPLCPSDISPASGGNPAAPTVFFAHCGTSQRRAVTPCWSLRFPRPAFGCLGFAKGTFAHPGWVGGE